MQALLNLINRVQSLSSGKVFIATFSNENNKKIVIQLNQENQLKFGILSSGQILPNYSPYSQRVFGKPNSPITLYDTGDFYDSFNINDITEESFTIKSNPIKTDNGFSVNLLNEYGVDVLGLNDENLAILSNKVLPYIREVTLKHIQGNETL